MADSTYILVPGAGGVAAYWRPVADELRRRGHEAIPVDLPGDDAEAGLTQYADLLVAAADNRSAVVLVGQSMGAFPAAMAAARLSASRLVLLNAMIPAPGETPGDWWENTGQADARRANETAAGRNPDAPFDERSGFFHDVPAEVTREAFSRPERGQAGKPFGEPWPLAAWPDVPTSGIAGSDDRIFPLEFQQRVARERLGIELAVIPSGHLPSLSVPDALVAAILGG